MSIAHNKAVARRLLEEVWNEGKAELLGDLHTPDATITDPYNPVPGRGGQVTRIYLANYKRAMPDLRIHIDEQVAEGDVVVNFLTVTGTHEGTLLGVAPTHKHASVDAVVRLRFRNGRIFNSTILWDALGFVRMIGAFEPEMAGGERLKHL